MFQRHARRNPIDVINTRMQLDPANNPAFVSADSASQGCKVSEDQEEWHGDQIQDQVQHIFVHARHERQGQGRKIGTYKHVVANEGRGALLTDMLPTFQGYFVQGWFKFGGVGVCKRDSLS